MFRLLLLLSVMVGCSHLKKEEKVYECKDLSHKIDKRLLDKGYAFSDFRHEEYGAYVYYYRNLDGYIVHFSPVEIKLTTKSLKGALKESLDKKISVRKGNLCSGNGATFRVFFVYIKNFYEEEVF